MSLSSNISPPPDGGYGWVCVAACFSINCFTWGAVSSYGVYLAHYLSNNIFPEATPMDFALIGGLNFSMAMLVAPAVTIIARKYGTQLPMLLGLGLLASGYVSASFSQRIWQLYLSQGVLIGFGVGFIYIPSIPVLSQWFDKKRSLANGISAAGSGIGGLIFSFMDGSIIQKISLAWALRFTAIISCSILIIAILLIRTRNEAIQPSQRGFDVKLLRRLDVLLLLSWAFLSMLGYICLLFSLPDYARSIGLSDNQATVVNAILNLGTAVGRPLIGVSSDCFGRIEVAGLLTCFCGITCFVIWLPSASYGALVLFAFISGAILGVFWVTVGPLCVEVAGLEQLQSLLSLSWVFTVLPTTCKVFTYVPGDLSEVIALKLRRLGSYQPYRNAQVFCGISYICASMALLSLWMIKRRKVQTGV
ncbi:major facilitator superfamily domain-containing protein [Penicillium hordei]|uniref:Major facilitator superfamily domain-containing protein n=1 Tax=Penicillium hordei TaxID=40994 RepID=A0AAD6E059_9EURO|nr:major facilitator superfamily domain-containing protein [Penicillium hordei]KAJ5597463.1 major facilitator superfamily domain-containing protein [Penicillium hordei]